MPDVDQVCSALSALRTVQAEVLAPMPIAEIVDALEGTACRLADDAALPPHDAQVRVSLDGLLPSLRREALCALLRDEFGDPRALDGFVPRASGGWQRAIGPAVSAHFLAGNTPLLSWTSFAAALLVKSAVFGKLPRAGGDWPRAFTRALGETHPALAHCVHLEEWPGGTAELDGLLCREADAVIAYGRDETLDALRALTPSTTPFHAYGHRLSIGVVLRGADLTAAAEGLARDILLYDQEGCLSAALLLVEGEAPEAIAFAERLAASLDALADALALPPRTAGAAAPVRSLRQTALFAPDARVWGDPGLRWTLLYTPGAEVAPPPGPCVAPVLAFPDLNALPCLLRPLCAHLQGAALAAPPERTLAAAEVLARCGVNRVCAPGALQAPPFSWHHDGRPVLASLVRWTDLER